MKFQKILPDVKHILGFLQSHIILTDHRDQSHFEISEAPMVNLKDIIFSFGNLIPN